ncbi:MarR family winged helix-turn-helix transcriptional regulator [Ferrovibrio xuzhouensis]|uniref:MarR family winged helix-turn-helix transcriptional regulator n=1 Tax=Ferrovibrio xuzhouensis TaxID=1576914 RepID=A0ABV7VBP3_9PROT
MTRTTPPAKHSSADSMLQLDNQLCFAIYSAGLAFNRLYKPLLDAMGLTYPQYLVMLALWEQDGQTVGELGERLFLESSTLTPLLKRLETAGYVTRRRNPDDERQVRIALTKAGAALKQRAAICPSTVLEASGRSLEELMRLKDAASGLRDAFNAFIAAR